MEKQQNFLVRLDAGSAMTIQKHKARHTRLLDAINLLVIQTIHHRYIYFIYFTSFTKEQKRNNLSSLLSRLCCAGGLGCRRQRVSGCGIL